MRSSFYSILAPILAGLAGLAGLLALLSSPDPVGAQACTYDLVWDFDADLGEWGDDSTPMTHDDSTGYNAAGSMMLQRPAGTSGTFGSGLYADEILAALAVSDPDAYITAGGVTVAGWGYASGAGDSWRMTIFKGPGVSPITNTSTTLVGQWEPVAVTTGASIDQISLIKIDYQKVDNDAVSAWFDDVTISIPCENVVASDDPPPTITPTVTPTPRPTATPIGGITTTLPTPEPVITYGGSGGGGGWTLPEPLTIPPPPDNTINIDPLWDMDTMFDFVAIVRTVPVLLEQYKLITVMVAVGAGVLALRWLVDLTKRRSEEI